MLRINSSMAKAFSLLVCLALLVATVLLGTPNRNSTSSARSTAQTRPEKKEVRVWVNTKSGVYHCPGSRWYGTTKQGKYMGECEATKDGNRSAYGKPCGSHCK